MVWALLPVKDLVKAKSRLAGILAPHERRALAQAMVEDVLSALVASSRLEGVLLVSDDPGAELLAHKYKVQSVQESALGCHGLNSVIAAGCNLLCERGAESIMVVHSDLPLLRQGDVDQLVQQFEEAGGLLVASDLVGDGTNIMLFGCDQRPEFHYGPGSCPAHLAATRERGLRVQQLCLETVGLDIDEPVDLLALHRRLQAGERGEHTARLLLGSELQQRLKVMEANGMQDDLGTGT